MNGRDIWAPRNELGPKPHSLPSMLPEDRKRAGWSVEQASGYTKLHLASKSHSDAILP